MLEVIFNKTHDVIWNIILLFTTIFTIPLALTRRWYIKYKNKKITINGGKNE